MPYVLNNIEIFLHSLRQKEEAIPIKIKCLTLRLFQKWNVLVLQ